eukprot:1278150-Pyramimonas_sp.AAC.2
MAFSPESPAGPRQLECSFRGPSERPGTLAPPSTRSLCVGSAGPPPKSAQLQPQDHGRRFAGRRPD